MFQVDNLPFERDVGFQVDTLTTAASRPDSGVSVSVSPMIQTETPETELSFSEHQQQRVRTSSSGSSEGAIPKSTPPTKKRRPKRAKKSETRKIPGPVSDSKLLLQQELDSELSDLFAKLAALEAMLLKPNADIDAMVRPLSQLSFCSA